MATKPKTTQFEFDTALAELDALTAWFESDTTNLDEGLVKFERGIELAQQLKQHLTTVENRIEQITKNFADTAKTPELSNMSPAPADSDLFD